MLHAGEICKCNYYLDEQNVPQPVILTNLDVCDTYEFRCFIQTTYFRKYPKLLLLIRKRKENKELQKLQNGYIRKKNTKITGKLHIQIVNT